MNTQYQGIDVATPIWEIMQEEAGIINANSPAMSVLAKRAKESPFWSWAESSGLWIDRETFSFSDFAYLKPIYQGFPERDEDLYSHEVIVRKPAQAGGSVIFLTWCLYLMLRRVVNIGYYLPDQDTTYAFSQTRFRKMIENNPDLLQMLLDHRGHEDIGSKAIRRLGNSMLMFLYTGMNQVHTREQLTMKTEAMPLDALVFDEVQGMTRGQIEKTKERISASKIKFVGMVSTPKWPEGDIDEWYQQSFQANWYSACRCADGCNLAEEWPNCIGVSQGRVFWRCPHCDTEITDTQAGKFVKHNPRSPIRGYTWSQAASRRVSAAEMLRAWDESHDKQNFYNRKLGRPYANPNEIPITQEIIKRMQRESLSWPSLNSKTEGENFLGLDHMGALNVIIIKRRIASGIEAVIHLEWVESDDPFSRSAELMREYNIRFAALESLPNFNEAMRFAKAFPERVFIVEYGMQGMGGEMLRWADRDTSDPQAIRKTSDEARIKWSVRVDQYKMMYYSLGKVQDNNVIMPRQPLMQARLLNGRYQPDDLGALYRKHLTKIALVSERKDEREEKRTNHVQKIGSEDPHFSYANLCADIAIARAYGTTRLITQELEQLIREQQEQQKKQDPLLAQVQARIPVAGYIETDTCGGCANYVPDGTNGESKQGRCNGLIWRRALVQRSDPKCDDYMPISVN